MRLIDKTPPSPTGDAQKDVQALYQWCAYLQEQLNFIITNMERVRQDG